MARLLGCPVCGSNNIRFDFSASTGRAIDERMWTIDRCDSCSHGFVNPQPSWNDLAKYYSANYASYSTASGSHGAADDEVFATAQRTGEFRHIKIRPGVRILDVGCGAGFFLRIAAKLGAVVEGVEPNEFAAEQARTSGQNVFTGLLEDFARKYPGKRFDIITANHVLEHVPNPVATLSIMESLLASNGMVWIAVPNANSRFHHLLKRAGKYNSCDLPYHIMQFAPSSLSVAGEKAGLRMQSLETSTFPQTVADNFQRLLRWRLFIPYRLSRLIPLRSYIADYVARRLDSAGQGAAILANSAVRPSAPFERC